MTADESKVDNLAPEADEDNPDIVALHGTKGAPGYHLMHPKGSTGATIGTAIFEKHGQDAVEPLYPKAVTAFKTGHSINDAVDIAAAMSGFKQVPAYIKGKPAGYLPPGSEIYVGVKFKNNPKDAPVAYAKSGDQYFSITAAGVAPMYQNVAKTLQNSIDNKIFHEVPYGYGDIPEEKKTPNAPEANAPDANAPATPEAGTPDPTAKVPVYVNGKKVGYAPPGSKVYVNKNSAEDNNGKNTSMAFVQNPDGKWVVYSAGGQASPQSTTTGNALTKDAGPGGGLVEVHNEDDTPEDTLETKTPDPNATGNAPTNPNKFGLKDAQGNVIDANDFEAMEKASFEQQNTKPTESGDLKGPDGKPILPPKGEPAAPGSMQPNQPTLQKPAPSAPNAPAAPEVPEAEKPSTGYKKFVVNPDPGPSKKPGSNGYYNGIPGLWGDWGSAGVLVRHVDPKTGEEKFLLVQRGNGVSSNVGKWQLPGGALHQNENDHEGVARELTEELSPPAGYLDNLTPVGETIFNHESGWHYNNIAADAPEMFEPTVDGHETGDAKWVTVAEINGMDLHPALKQNLSKIMAHYQKPKLSKEDEDGKQELEKPEPELAKTEEIDDNTQAMAMGDAAMDETAPDPNTIEEEPGAPEQPKTAPKQVFVDGKSVGEVPPDSKVIVLAMHKSDPNNASTAYVIHKDGTAEVFNGPGGGKKLSEAATALVKRYENEGDYIDVDKANAENEALAAQQLDPNAPTPPGGVAPETPQAGVGGEEPWDIPNPDTAEPFSDLAPKPAPDPGESGEPLKDVYMKGNKVGEVPETSRIFVAPSSFKDSKNAPYTYVKHADGNFTVFEFDNPNGKNYEKDSSVGKYIDKDITGEHLAEVKDYDEGDGTDDDVSPTSGSLNEPSGAKVDVGGVQVNAKELATAINALKNGESWQVKVHLKNHPLHKMDYLSLAKDYNTKKGKTYPTKEAVIRALEEKFKKLPATDAEEAVVEANVKSLDELEPPKTEVEVGGIKVNKKQLLGAIALVESGPSPYPKVNLKGHVLHGLDMPNIMWQESKKPDESTKAVLLKHMKKKAKQFVDDELTGESVVEPPKPAEPVKGLAQLVKEADEKKKAPIETPPAQKKIDLPYGVSLKPGVYKKPGGYFAKLIVEPDGKLYYHGSKKTGKLEISPKKAANLHDQGFQHYVGPPEGATADGPGDGSVDTPTETPGDGPSMQGFVSPGTYYATYPGTFEVFPDGTAMFTGDPSGTKTAMSQAEFQKVVSKGTLIDKYGTSVVPPGVDVNPNATFHVFGSTGMSLVGLQNMRDDVAASDVPSTLLTTTYKINSDSLLDYMKANKHHGGIKNTALYKLDELIHAAQTKQTNSPNTAGLPINNDAKKVSPDVFKFHPKTGYATSDVKQPGFLMGMSTQNIKDKIGEISKSHGGGVVGSKSDSFAPGDAQDWLDAWYKGDMKKVYEIDSSYVQSLDSIANHPGAPGNKATHQIVWQPAVEGELPAGQPVNLPGGLPDPKVAWTTEDINAYMVAANAQNTEYYSPELKENWVTAHASGDKITTDLLSQMTKKLADNPASAPTGSPSATPAGGNSTEEPKSYAGYLENKTGPYDWHGPAIDDFIADNGLYPSVYGDGIIDRADVVQDFLAGKKSVMVNDTLVKKVPLDSVIYYEKNSSKVYVKHADGTMTKFGSAMSGLNGKEVTDEWSLKLVNADMAAGHLEPWTADKTVTSPATVPGAPAVPAGPGMLTVANGSQVEIPADAEIWAYTNKKGAINGFYLKFPNGKITYNSATNSYQGVNNVGAKKFNDAKDGGLITQIPHPGATPAAPAAPVEAPVYKLTDAAGLVLGNNPQTINAVDQFGNRFVYKPYNESEMFRAHAEHGANIVSRMFGFPTADSQIIEIEGKNGQLQNKLNGIGDFTGVEKEDIAKMSQAELNQLAQEHLLDWQLENPDSRQLNILRIKGGSVAGIDKGMFGKHWGEWNGLEPNSKNVMYEDLVYTKLYDGIRDGLYTQEQIDSIYNSVMTRARQMQRVSDADIRPVITAAMTPNPYRDENEFADGFLARKNQLMDDMNKLWDRVYAMTDYTKPEFKLQTLNNQGHALHAGFTPDLVEDVHKSKSYGTSTFVGGLEVEDMHVVNWREKIQGTDKFNYRGELKVRGTTLSKVESWLKSRATTVTSGPPPPPQVHNNDATWHASILKAVGNIAYHSDDGNYNPTTLQAMEQTKKELNQLLSDNETNPPDSSEVAKIAAQNEMAKQYLGYIKDAEDHKAASTKPSKENTKRYVYTPPPKSAAAPSPQVPTLKVERMNATRAKNVSPEASEENIALDSDGEMVVSPTQVLDNYSGNSGQMYLVTLETGETIEFRGNDTGTSLASRGLTRYTIPPEANVEQSMQRINNQLKDMGLDLKPAEDSDYELFYWRHLANTMRERNDSKPGDYGKYSTFWNTVDTSKENKGGPEEIDMWRNAFSTLTSKQQVDEWTKEGRHLPKFQHWDINNPTQATGKPIWDRFDVTEEDIEKSDFLIMGSQNPNYVPSVAKTGGSMSTEGRLRAFGSWLSGSYTLSSSTDQKVGSASFVFTRQGLTNKYMKNTRVILAKHVSARSNNYAYHDDSCGDIKYKKTQAPFNYPASVSKSLHGGSPGNEMMIKDGVSVLDDVEIMFFDTASERDEHIKYYKDRGISEIRGVPLSMRFIFALSGSESQTPKKTAAIEELREYYAKQKKK